METSARYTAELAVPVAAGSEAVTVTFTDAPRRVVFKAVSTKSAADAEQKIRAFIAEARRLAG